MLLAAFLSIALATTSDAAPQSLPAADYSGVLRIAKWVYRTANAPNASNVANESELSDPDPEPIAAPAELGIPALPQLGGPKGFVEGLSVERPELRTERTKTYTNPDGTRTTQFYEAPIHYLAPDLGWTDIDTNFVQTDDGLTNSGGPVRHTVGNNVVEGGIAVDSLEGRVRIALPDATPSMPASAGSRALYNEVFPGIDFEVVSQPFGLKPSLILTDSATALSTFRFELDTSLTPVMTGDGGIDFLGREGSPVFQSPPGIAFDSKARPPFVPVSAMECTPASEENRGNPGGGQADEHPSRDCENGARRRPEQNPGSGTTTPRVRIEDEAGRRFITTSIDEFWLRDPARAFPVTIDPMLIWFTKADTMVSALSPDQNFVGLQTTLIPKFRNQWRTVRGAGRDPTYGEQHTLLAFSVDEAQPAQFTQIIDVNLSVYVNWEVDFGRHNFLSQIASPWSPWTATWNNQPWSSPIDAEQKTRNGDWMIYRGGQLNDVLRSWLTGQSPAYGFKLWGYNGEFKLVGSAFDGRATAPRLGITYNSPPNVALGGEPANETIFTTESPTFTHLPAIDPDGDRVHYQIRITTDTGGQHGQVIASDWSDDPNRKWTVPPGVLRDGATYYWGVWTSDGSAVSPSSLRPAPAGWARVFRIESRRIGVRPHYAMQTYSIGTQGAFSVNAQSGNLVATVAGPTFPTAGESYSPVLSYNSQAPRELGLVGTYYQWDGSLTRLNTFPADGVRFQRNDSMIAFDWGSAPPGPNLPRENFAVRWTGFIRVPTDGKSYYIGTASDDGVRVTVGRDERRLIDAFYVQSLSYRWAVEPLAPGIQPITIEYFQGPGDAQMHLLWRTVSNNSSSTADDLAESPVPPTNLSPRASRLPARWQFSNSLHAGSDAPASIQARETNDALVRLSDGSSFIYSWNGSSWVPPPDLGKTALHKNEDGTWTYETDDGTTYYYDKSGLLTWVYSPVGQATARSSFQFVYDSDDLGIRLKEIRDLAGQERNGSAYAFPDRRIAFEYEAVSAASPTSGYLREIRYWDGSQTEIVYGPAGGLRAVVNPGGARTAFSYDPTGLIIAGRGVRSHDEASSYTTDVDYYPSNPQYQILNRVAHVTKPAPAPGESRAAFEFRYADPDGNSTTIVDPVGLKNVVSFDSAGRQISSRDPAGLQARKTYDFKNNVIEAVAPDGTKALYSYDHRGRVSSVRGPRTHPDTGELVASSTVYDEGVFGLQGVYYNNRNLSGAGIGQPAGPALVRTDPNINFNWSNGSPDSRLVNSENYSVRWSGEVIVPASGTYRFFANADDGVRVYVGGQRIIDAWRTPAGSVESSYFHIDAGTLPIVVEYFEATGLARASLEWEGPGWGRRVIANHELHPAYGLPTTILLPDGSTTKTRYGLEPHKGLPATTERTIRNTDGTLVTLRKDAVYDDLGRLTRLVSSDGTSLALTYWGLRDEVAPPLPCVGDPAVQAGLPRKVVPPPGKPSAETFYDGTGRPIASVLGTAHEGPACTSYDERGRVKRFEPSQIAASPGALDQARPITYSYNSDDKLVSADDGAGGGVVSDYDRLGRLVSHRDANGQTTAYSYDLSSKPVSSTGPAGNQGAQYDQFGRPTRSEWIFDGIAAQQVDSDYDWAGRLAEERHTNGTRTRYRYSPSSELIEREDLSASGERFLASSVDRDMLGRITHRRELGGPPDGTDFDYDDAARLTRVGEGSTERLYNFDQRANRKSVSAWAPRTRFESPGKPTQGRFGPTGRWNYNPHSTIFASAGINPVEDARLVYGPDSWSDYKAEVSIKFHSGAIDAGMDLRWRAGGSERYIVALRAGDVALHKVRSGQLTTVASIARPHNLGTWYRLQVGISGGRIEVFEDGSPVIAYEDPEGGDKSTYERSGHNQGAFALSSYNSWTEFSNLQIADPQSQVVLADNFGARTIEGDWQPAGGELRQLRQHVGERHGIPINGSHITGDFEARAEIRFDAGDVDGGFRFKRDATGAAYTLALRANDMLLLDTDGSVAWAIPMAHSVGATYSIRIRMTGSTIEVFRDGVGIRSWTDPSPQISGEFAPYSWTSAITVRNIVVAPPSPTSETTYEYNATDQLTRNGPDCSVPDCLVYDHRGNTTKHGQSDFRFDTANRITFSQSHPRQPASSSPLSVSPSGSAVVFSSDRDGNSEIYSMPPQGGNMTRLTDNAANDTQPVFSPDGARIYFASDRDGDFEIYSMAADGSDQRRLTESLLDDLYPALSPDGIGVIFTSERDGNGELYLMDGDGANQRRLTSTAEYEAYPRFSPASGVNKVLFTTSASPGLFQIGVLDLDTSSRAILTSAGTNGFGAWRGDGARIVFTSWRDTDDEIYSMAVDGTDQIRLTDREGVDSAPTYLPDNRIMFVSDRSGDLEIYTMANDGSNVTQVSSGARLTSIPAFGAGAKSRARVSYAYDALGRLREMRTTQGALTQVLQYGYSAPGSKFSYLQREDGAITFRSWAGPGGLYATAILSPSGWEISWAHFDERGDTRAMTNAAGSLVWSGRYDEYGGLVESTGGEPAYAHHGKSRIFNNSLTGLLHMGARLYDPAIGRFLTRDPILGGSASDYEYTAGDPINRSDKSGTIIGGGIPHLMSLLVWSLMCAFAGCTLGRDGGNSRAPTGPRPRKGGYGAPSRTWHVFRFAVNAPTTMVGTALGTLGGGSCHMAPGLTVECTGAQHFYNRGGTMYGNAFVTNRPEVAARVNIHEQKHADQWALYTLAGGGSPFGFVTSYGTAEGMAALGTKITGVKVQNPFECLADAGGGHGGYCPGW